MKAKKVYSSSDPRFYDGWSREYLIDKIIELQEMLKTQHDAVNDAARNWRKIGYDQGKADGFDEASRLRDAG